MRILENSPDRLRLFFGSWGISGTICTLDKQKDRASVTQLVLLMPVRRVRIPLSSVADAHVLRRGPDTDRRYYLALRLRFGNSLRIAQQAKTDALELVSTIQGFLKIA